METRHAWCRPGTAARVECSTPPRAPPRPRVRTRLGTDNLPSTTPERRHPPTRSRPGNRFRPNLPASFILTTRASFRIMPLPLLVFWVWALHPWEVGCDIGPVATSASAPPPSTAPNQDTDPREVVGDTARATNPSKGETAVRKLTSEPELQAAREAFHRVFRSGDAFTAQRRDARSSRRPD